MTLGTTTLSIMTFTKMTLSITNKKCDTKQGTLYCYAKCHYAKCIYAECHSAECRYAECRGAFELIAV
jgi:hypothetical protein